MYQRKPEFTELKLLVISRSLTHYKNGMIKNGIIKTNGYLIRSYFDYVCILYIWLVDLCKWSGQLPDLSHLPDTLAVSDSEMVGIWNQDVKNQELGSYLVDTLTG